MPNYYNQYPNYMNPLQPSYLNPYPQQPAYYSPQQNMQYMINVDGEVGAKAWQSQSNLAPNTVVPLWDFDGVHVYFKSTDAYGRMNPLRKAKVIFEDEPQNLPQASVSGETKPSVNFDQFVTKDDLKELKQEIRSMLNNQNGNDSYAQNRPQQQNNTGNRGGNR